MRVFCLILGLLLLQHEQVKAWGSEGHSIIAEIAQRHLTPAARERIAELLPAGASLASMSLASISFWADEKRDSFEKSSRWHFVSIPLNQTNYDEKRDCSDGPRGDCVIKAIEREKTKLVDPKEAIETRLEALKYLVHFVGDLHQPLHTVQEMGGGFGCKVDFFVNHLLEQKFRTDLHWVWDTGLLRASFRSWGSYLSFLEEKWLPERNFDELTRGTAIEWALESHQIAIDVGFASVKCNSELGKEYLDRARPHVDRQLAIAGLRLARILNEALK